MNFIFTGCRRAAGAAPIRKARPGTGRGAEAQGQALWRDSPAAASRPCPHVKGSRRSIPRHAAGLFRPSGSPACRPVLLGGFPSPERIPLLHKELRAAGHFC